MFFEEDNCRAIRLLNEAGNFLEASLEKLLTLEQEVILEMKEKEKIKNQTNVNSNSEKIINSGKNNEKVDNLKLAELDTISDNIESISNCSSEKCDHKNNFLSKKIRLSYLNSQHSPHCMPGTLKRKYSASELNDNLSNNTAFVDNQEVKKAYRNNPTFVKKIKTEKELDDTIGTSTLPLEEAVPGNLINCEAQTATQSKKVTLLEEFFKVCIKFKESLPYETVEELIRSVGLDDVFDIVLTKKKAEVTFLNESSMKKALNLSKAALCILKADIILPVMNPKCN